MELSKQESSKNSIISFNKTTVSLTHTQLNIPCFVSPNFYKELDIKNISEINNLFLFPLTNADNINLVIIGTGDKTQFLQPKQLIAINKMGLNLETMNNRSACYSFNLLLADKREVGLMIL